MIKKYKIFFLNLLIFNSILLCSQNSDSISHKTLHYELTNFDTKIDLIIVSPDTCKQKKILLFCQNEDPTPLFFDFGDDKIFMYAGGIINFDYKKLTEKFHLLIISKPNIPLIYNSTKIINTEQGIKYAVDKFKKDGEFLKNDNLENNVTRANLVLDFLSTKKWVDTSKIVIIGYSRGAEIAAEIAINRKNVSKLILLNPFSEESATSQILKIRQDAEKNKLTMEDAYKQIDEIYELYKTTNNQDIITKIPVVSYYGSYSFLFLENLINFNNPIYLGYGTDDVAAKICDIIPIYFIKNKKENLYLKRFVGLDHNFQPLNNDKNEWNDVIKDVLNWIE